MKVENSIKQIKYDFSNAESQKLFKEFTVILAEITKYVENQDEEIISNRKELVQTQGELSQTQRELVQLQEKYNDTQKELKQLQDKQNELLAELELVTSGRYMVKAILKKAINKLKSLFK